VRRRLIIHRHAVAYWAAAGGLAVLAALLVVGQAERAAGLAREYGPLVDTPVVRRAITAGDVVTARDILVRRLPKGAVPKGAAAHPVGHAALIDLEPGEVVLTTRLAPWGRRGAAALLPDGARAIAVPSGPGGRPPVSPGNTVDVLATFEAVATDGTTTTELVVADALVVAIDREADTVTIAVAADDAPRLAEAVVRARITIALA
jgi:Flp pilus assembly protein CpaB